MNDQSNTQCKYSVDIHHNKTVYKCMTEKEYQEYSNPGYNTPSTLGYIIIIVSLCVVAFAFVYIKGTIDSFNRY